MEILGIDLGQFDLQAWLLEAWRFAGPRLVQSAGIGILAGLSYWVARWILRRVERKWTARTATELDDLLVRMIRRAILIAIVFWTVWRVAGIWELPQVARVVVAIWIVALSLPVSHFVGDILEAIEARFASKTGTTLDDTALPMVNKVVRFLVVATAALIALEWIGVNIAPLLAGAGVMGLGLSFAAKDTLSNLIAGVLLIVDRPFHVGDRIELWSAPAETGSWGDVVEIGLRATKIRNPDNLIIIIPNSEIMRRDIVNYTASGTHIRLRIPIGVAYDSDLNLAKELILGAAREAEGVKLTPEPLVIQRGFGPSEVKLQLRVWISNARERRKIADEITEQVNRRFQEHGIEIPYPKRDLYIKAMPEGPKGATESDASRV